MNFWKIRHKPTGLFYKPSKHQNKSNLSKVGKTYGKKPTLKNLGEIYYHPDDEDVYKYFIDGRPVVKGEWEIVRYLVVEDGIEKGLVQ